MLSTVVRDTLGSAADDRCGWRVDAVDTEMAVGLPIDAPQRHPPRAPHDADAAD